MTFDPFGDFGRRGYLRNVLGLSDPGEVRRAEHAAFRDGLRAAMAALRAAPEVGYAEVLGTHRALFGAFYPWAGRDRAELLPGLAVAKAGAFDLFAHPADVRRAAGHALDLARDRARLRGRPGEVYGLLAHAHPFLDGNGRTITAVHAELARRAGFHIDWPAIPKAGFLDALTRDPRARALDALLLRHLRDGAMPARTTEARLRAHPGLGP